MISKNASSKTVSEAFSISVQYSRFLENHCNLLKPKERPLNAQSDKCWVKSKTFDVDSQMCKMRRLISDCYVYTRGNHVECVKYRDIDLTNKSGYIIHNQMQQNPYQQLRKNNNRKSFKPNIIPGLLFRTRSHKKMYLSQPSNVFSELKN